MKELTKRKPLRLQGYNYSSKGVYFVTICVKDRKPLLSKIIIPTAANFNGTPIVCLKPLGKTVEKHLLSSEKICGVKIEKYIIMPDHIHALIFIDPYTDETQQKATRSPTNKTLPHIISAFKRLCNKAAGENIFQRAYMEHIIRDTDDFESHRKYIRENPIRWYYKHNTL